MEIKTFVLKEDIIAFCKKATSFPDGVLAAHQQLHQHVLASNKRNYFGISYLNFKKEIIYKAAVDELFNGELKHLELEQVIIKNGTYAYINVLNFKEKIHEIELAFKILIKHALLDPNGFCLEWYAANNKDCKCMVRLIDQ